MRESRPQVLLHHINLALQKSSLTFRRYATDVRDAYNARTPVCERGIEFHETRDPYNDERLNAQIVKRAIDDAHKLPCCLEEALVLALPQPFQAECRRELAARYGELAAQIPTQSHGAAVADAAALMRETGEALAELSQCFVNDQVPADKRVIAVSALGNLNDVQACVETLKARLQSALNPTVVQLSKVGQS